MCEAEACTPRVAAVRGAQLAFSESGIGGMAKETAAGRLFLSPEGGSDPAQRTGGASCGVCQQQDAARNAGS